MRRPPDDVVQLRMEHEAMASTLAAVEEHVSPEVMTSLRQHYMTSIMAAKGYPQGYGG
jgi:hypothetical protein